MIRFSKIVFTITVTLLIIWILPWCYQFLTTTKTDTPFTLYSGVINDFAFIEHADKGLTYKDVKNQVYSEHEFDSILPLFFYRQLLSEERLPNRLFGVDLTPRLIQTENFNFRIDPNAVNTPSIGLYPLLESMSGRVDLEMPDDVFRLSERMEFIDIETNAINEFKTNVFTQMLQKKGFKFPAKSIAGNPTDRKEYDEGYLILDAEHNLFHVKQVKRRPYVRKIEIPKQVLVQHMFLTEFKNRKFLAFVSDSQQRFWVLETQTYTFKQVDIPSFDPACMSMSIIGNMFDWTIIVNDGKTKRYFAIDASNYHCIKSLTYEEPELTPMQKFGLYLFPIQLYFTEPTSPLIFPRWTLSWF